jgi:PQQ-dependent dehydrogenase (s-GDH family)
MRIVNPGYQLNSAWELTYGPDDSLWVTESNSYLVDKINPVNGGKTRLLDLSGQKDFAANLADWPQGGLMGMALHPTMYSQWPAPAHPWVYLAYVYHNAGCKSNNAGCFFKTRIVRYAYDHSTRKLKNPVTIIESLNGSTDHNSGRLTIGEVNGTPYLFYTIGDMGTGQFKNLSRTNHAQTRDSLEGKVLRFNLDATGDPDDVNSWIPADNPYEDKNGKTTAVWSWGHRNAQGLAFGTNGILYSSEQQDMSDDEINIIEKGQNYGWPMVSGYCDGNYDGYTLANMPVVSEKLDSVNFNLRPPVFTLFTASNPGPLYGTSNSTWPTVACSSIEVYEHNIIPGWNRSLLVPSLKAGMVQRLKLDITGKKVTDTSSIPSMRLFGKARLRDLCVSPDGLKIYISCDMSSQSSMYQGKILEFTYAGPANFLSINDSVSAYTRNIHIQVFPNPASDILYVRTIKNTSHPVRYDLYDVTGKRVLNGSSHNDLFAVHTGTLSPGIYILKLYNTYQVILDTRKIIIH